MRSARGSWRRVLGVPVAAMALVGGGITVAALAWWAVPASAAPIHVSTEAAFRTAWDSNANDSIVLDADIHLGVGTCVRADRSSVNDPITIDGQGQFKIVQDCPGHGVLIVLSDSNVTLRGVTITGGSGSNAGDGDGGLEFANTNPATWTIDHSTITNNTASDDGGGIEIDGPGTLNVTASSLLNNRTGDDGGGINCDNTGVTINVTGSTLAGNSNVPGLGNTGAAIDLENSGCALKMTNSTVTTNTSGDDAAITAEDRSDTISIAYSTIVNNATNPATPGAQSNPGAQSTDEHGKVHAEGNITAVATANLEVANPANVTLFGTVIARPHGGPNCSTYAGAPLTGVVSAGYNLVDDTSCGLTTATDKQGATFDPLVGPLANNGGATQTLLPGTGSPLIDAIPVAACQTGPAAGVTTDQRGIARPQGAGCEIGAVEIMVIVAPPRFTG
jgi:hypothetical protein